MLSIFRSKHSQKFMVAILALGLFAIVATGFGTDGMGGLGGVTGGGGGQSLVSVGGEAVTPNEVGDQVNRQLDRARQQEPEMDVATFVRAGAFEEVLRQLVSQKAMVAFAEKVGIGVSKRMVDGQIASIPQFKNIAGQFDQQAFRQALQREKITEDQLRRELAGVLIQRQILLPVAGSPFVPQAMATQYASLLLEQRSGTVGLVPAAAMGVGREPTDADVAAFYRQNQGRYTIPERRVIRYALIGPEQVAAAVKPTEAEIAAVYRQNQAQYGAKETRTLSQVVLPDEAAARAFAAKIAGGTSFAAAAAQAGFGAGDIAVGNQGREQFARLSSPAVAAAAFAAAQGATTAPVRSPLGWHVVRVDAINSTAARPLAAVRGEIEQRLSQQKSVEALNNLVSKVEEAVGEGSSFEEVARANGLTLQESPPVTGAGLQPGVSGWQPPAELGPLLKPAFDMSVDDDPVVEAIVPNQRFALFAVTRIIPAAPPPLQQIGQIVKADLVKQRAFERARAVATALVAKINGGIPARQAFAEADVKLPAPQAVKARRIDIARPNQPVPPPLAMMFSLPRGKARLLAAPQGAGWFVVHLEQTVAGNAATAPQLIQATRSQFQRIVGEEYAAQFSQAVEKSLNVKRNDDAIRAAKQELLRGGLR
ncbi:MAG TPA: peptidyl-prolyl cis-trans isomerase [Allosphingosinicella sp.]|jgi:peptidyl-prolyl cis-trans isomerase D